MSPLKLYCEGAIDDKLQPFLQSNKFQWVSISECKYVLHPSILWSVGDTSEQLSQISKSHQHHQKRVMVFIVDDFEKRYPTFNNLILFRTSLRRSLKRNNEYLLPYIWECSERSFEPVNGGKTPVVGFCGMDNRYRKKTLQYFEKAPGIEANFIIREKFWGGAAHDPQIIQEYNQNIESSPYNICNRGRGNFSMRFYQTLAFGRIPVLVDTDMVFPFENEIDWSQYVIAERSPKKCAKRVLTTFESGEYIEMQRNCRKLFDQYFSPENGLYLLMNQIKEPGKPWFSFRWS